jgi:hypothetical protein
MSELQVVWQDKGWERWREWVKENLAKGIVRYPEDKREAWLSVKQLEKLEAALH